MTRQDVDVEAELPLIGRHGEQDLLTAVFADAARGHGRALLLTGEAGIGKTRLLREAEAMAASAGLAVFRGRAVRAGGVYRPLVEAFGRAASASGNGTPTGGWQPSLSRLLPGSQSGTDPMGPPMADPAAVLAEALLALVDQASPTGAAVLLDDLHWADLDTIAVITSMVDGLHGCRLAMIMAARTEPSLPTALQALRVEAELDVVPLGRLETAAVDEVVRRRRSSWSADQVRSVVERVDGLPFVLDDVMRFPSPVTAPGEHVDLGHSRLAASVELWLASLAPDARRVIDALSVVGETDADVLLAAALQDAGSVARALREGMACSLLVPAETPLGVDWRHQLIAEAVRRRLLPLEQMGIAQRAADQLTAGSDLDDGLLRRSASLFELAGQAHRAARQWVWAARLAIGRGALAEAQNCLDRAQTLEGSLSDSATSVAADRIETLVLSGHAAEGYEAGVRLLASAPGRPRWVQAATVHAAIAAGRFADARGLLEDLHADPLVDEGHVMLLTGALAVGERDPGGEFTVRDAAAMLERSGQHELACEALVLAGIAARRRSLVDADALLARALELAERQRLVLWRARALGELGVIDVMRSSDATRLRASRALAVETGMTGLVAELDMRIAQTVIARSGHAAAIPLLEQAVAQSRRLGLLPVEARTQSLLVECRLMIDAGAGRSHASRVRDEQMINDSVRLAREAGAVPHTATSSGVAAWLRGESSAAAAAEIESTLTLVRDEPKFVPWWGLAHLLRVIEGEEVERTFGNTELLGHHANHAARYLAEAVLACRNGWPITDLLARVEVHLSGADLLRHVLRTAAVPALAEAGYPGAIGWLREADAFCAAAGERGLQSKVRRTLAALGQPVPRTGETPVPPHLARLGVTSRESDILRRVNEGASNAEIASQLVISVRTVESHISHLMQKTGCRRRDELPAAVPPRS